MSSIAELKKMTGDFSKLLNEVEKQTNPESQTKNFVDDRFWKLTRDKAGNGSAIIRFLPAPKGEDMPWIRIWDHAFQGPTGRWYIEKSLTTIGQQDIVSEENSVLWNTGDDKNRNIARSRKRRLNYYSNILVVNDPANPENNGKVFLYKYGKKIYERLIDKMKPEFEDQEANNPFDPFTGNNFRLRIRNVDGWPSYDKSEFEMSSRLAKTDEECVRIWECCHSLVELVSLDKFKTYDELKARYNMVMSAKSGTNQTAAESIEDQVSRSGTGVAEMLNRAVSAPMNMDDDDDDVSYFERLAADD